jgi:hypothetical protein
MSTTAQPVEFLLSGIKVNGNVLTTGKVFFYEAGPTSTLKPVYLDRNKAVEAANPYDLDANGTAQLYADGIYRIVIKNTNGSIKPALWTTEYDWDGLPFIPPGFSGIVDAFLGIVDEDYTTLALADAAAVAAGSQLAITKVWDVVPATLAAQVKFVPGGGINNAGSVAFTHQPEAGQYKVFFGAGAITGLHHALPEWWGIDGVDDNVQVQAAINSSNNVILADTTYNFASGVTIARSGVRLRGARPSETGTAYATSGTRIVYSGSGNAITVDGGITIEQVYLGGIGLRGVDPDTGTAIYIDEVRFWTLEDIIIDGFGTAIHSEKTSWMFKMSNVKAFNFTTGFYANSGTEDFIMENCLFRGYQSDSVGLHLNYYMQVGLLQNCDFSDSLVNVKVVASFVGSHPVVTFKSCIFEQGKDATGGFANSAGFSFNTSVNQTVVLEGCRFLFKSDTHRSTASAFTFAGAGRTYLVMNGTRINKYNTIFHATAVDSTGSISGKNNIIVNSEVYTIFSSIRRRYRDITWAGVNNPDNLLSTGGVLRFTHNFAAPMSLDISKLGGSGLGDSGMAVIHIKRLDSPSQFYQATISHRGFNVNGEILDQTDPASAYSGESISVDTFSISGTNTGDVVVKVIM